MHCTVNENKWPCRLPEEERKNKADKMWFKCENNHTQEHMRIDHRAHVGTVVVGGNLNKKAHATYCFWLPIMIRNPLAAQEYYTNMSGLWFGHNLHGYNSLSTDSRLSGARWLHCNDWPCASDSLFQASLAQSPGPPYLVNTQSWSRYLHLHKHSLPPPAPVNTPHL